MPENRLRCWKCDDELHDVLIPLSRTEACSKCGADLHVCRMCKFYDTRVNNSCQEPIADYVSDKARANFCGYLELKLSDAKTRSPDDRITVSDELNDLFDLPTDSADQSSSIDQLRDLFDIDDSSN
jgi:hypothetical protein